MFVGYDEAFSLARENTIGEEVKGYEYNYTLTANASYSKLSLSGQTQGTTKYNSESVLKFFDKRVNSGNLFFDGVEYQLLEGTTLQSISLNEENKVKKFKNEYVDNNYKFDTSSFAKALFEYDEEKLGSIEKTNKECYEIIF